MTWPIAWRGSREIRSLRAFAGECDAQRGATTRYLITGGAGFIGSHVADALVARRDEVVVLDDFSTGRRANIDHLVERGSAELIEGSVTDAPLVDRADREVRRLPSPRLGGRRDARRGPASRHPAPHRPGNRRGRLERGSATESASFSPRRRRSTARTRQVPCTRNRTGSSGRRTRAGGHTRSPSRTARRSRTATTASLAPTQSSCACSTRSAHARSATTGWSCPGSSGRRSPATT